MLREIKINTCLTFVYGGSRVGSEIQRMVMEGERMEQEKIATVPKSFRLPEDVVEIIKETAEITKQSESGVVSTWARVSKEDAERVLQGAKELYDNGEIQSGDVIQIVRPQNRDRLADAITTLMFGSGVGDKDMISALGVARARVYKGTPEYQERKEREGEKFFSPYEDEKALAEKLSKTGGAGNYTATMREKGEK